MLVKRSRYQVDTRRRTRTGGRAVLAGTIMIVTLMAGCSNDEDGSGGGDAASDVTVGACDNSTGGLQCEITVVNHSESAADYTIEATVEDASGTNVGTVKGQVEHLDAGQTATDSVLGTAHGVPFIANPDVTIHITQVERTPA
jgi:hypothetical protein